MARFYPVAAPLCAFFGASRARARSGSRRPQSRSESAAAPLDLGGHVVAEVLFGVSRKACGGFALGALEDALGEVGFPKVAAGMQGEDQRVGTVRTRRLRVLAGDL